jgi:hypothetical protein
VADFDGWDSGFLGVDQLSLNGLLHDVMYGRSDWERAGSGVERAREQGIDLAATQEIASGVSGGLVATLGWGSPAQLKAGLAGVVGVLGLKGLKAADRSGEVWRASTLAQDVAEARRVAARNGLKGLDENVLARGPNEAVKRLGYQDDMLPGSWLYDPRPMEFVPVEFLEQYAEFNRTGPRVNQVLREIQERGLDSPLIMTITADGRAGLLEGNHRLAAARQLGWEYLPVTVTTSKSGGVAPIKLKGAVQGGKIVKPSEVAEVPTRNVLSGGFTWDPRTGNFDFTTGFPVGVSPLHTHKIPVDQFHAKNILEFLGHKGYSTTRVSRLLADDPQKMIGGWVSEGNVYLDVSKIFDDVDEAKRVAAKFGELEIWDLAAGKGIKIADVTKPSLVARAAFGGKTPPAPADDLKGLPYYFGGERVAGGTLNPEMATVDFSKLDSGQKQWVAQQLIDQAPLRKFTPEDFNNKIVNDWLTLERQRLLALSDRQKAALGADRPGVDLVDFFKELSLQRVGMAVGKQGRMYRRMTNSILKGNFESVHKQLSAQANNLARFVGPESLAPNFYPYMAQMTLMNAQKTPAPLLAPLLASASPQVGPGGEAGRALRAMEKLKKSPKKYYRIENGVASYVSKDSGYDSTVIKLAIDLANNPDWIANPVRGLSIKTYVYGLLKLNPRLGRALVVDTVDTQMRLGTKMPISWDTTVGGEMAEIGLNQYVTRVMASYLDAPVFGVQESGWNTFRAVRDRFAGTPPSLTFKGRSIGDVYREIGLPPDLAALAQRNYAKLVDDVRAGRVTHWQEFPPNSNVLIPADNLPLEMLLEPTVRNKAGSADRFRRMVESAEELGASLRGANG